MALHHSSRKYNPNILVLSPGSRLGSYQIVAPLGAGGMGEVYLARDTRLDRDVAIKVLPEEVAADPSRLKRFESEARAASALNHPNIVTIYDIGSSDGVAWIAMEQVAGKTLREVLFAGALPMKRLLAIAAQIADGLATAHDAGIVHRDLKPENVMMTLSGLVKILDFGLAKRTSRESAGDEASNLATETGTSPGTVVGTVGYMSPEQAAGQPLDFHSDQFAFGSILYEMATGERAFQKRTAVETLSAILNEEPKPIAEINPQAPPPLRWTVERCHAKESERRYASTHDLARDLATLRDHISELTSNLAVEGATHPVYRRLTFRRGSIVSARFTPDSKTIVYCSRWENAPREMHAMRLEGPESRPMGPPDALLHAISSSGEMALVLGAGRPLKGLAQGVLVRMPVAGGAPREIAEDVQLADWLPSGEDLAVIRLVDGRPRLEFPIGHTVYEPSGWISSLRVSPRGDLVAFIEHLGDDLTGSVMVTDREGRIERVSRLWNTAHGLAWSPGGEEIWFTASGGTTEQALHGVTMEGRERLIAQVPGGLYLHDISGEGNVLLTHQVSRAGFLCRVAGEPTERELSWFDYSSGPALSSDGSAVLFSETGGGAGPLLSVYLRKTDGSPAIRLGDGEGIALSPDGRWALSVLVSLQKLLLIPTGAGQTREITHEGFTYRLNAAWFADGKRILFAASQDGRPPRSYIQDLDRPGASPVTPEGTIAHAISPDGRYVVAGGDPVTKMYPVEGGNPIVVAGAVPGDVPIRWHKDGRSLFVRSGFLPAKVFRIDLATGRRELFLELMPSDPVGVVALNTITITPDARSYAYSYVRWFSDLFLAEKLH